MWKQTVKAPGDRPKAPQQERQTSPNHPCFRSENVSLKEHVLASNVLGVFLLELFWGL